VVALDKTPPGQALTVREGVKNLDNVDLQNGCFVINSDQMVFFDFETIDFTRPSVGLYFNDTQGSCFYNLDINKKLVKEIKEKEKISCYASAGVFYFNNGQKILDCVRWGLANNKHYRGELYLGPCMEYFNDLTYFQTLLKFDLGNIKKIELFRSFVKHLIGKGE